MENRDYICDAGRCTYTVISTYWTPTEEWRELPDQTPCDDNNPCTSQDECWEGVCSGISLSGIPCDDGDPFTVNDVCEMGLCTGKKPIRGDANLDGVIDLSDAITLLLYLFKGLEVSYPEILDTNTDDTIDISDVIYLLNFLFTGGPPPQPIS